MCVQVQVLCTAPLRGKYVLCATKQSQFNPACACGGRSQSTSPNVILHSIHQDCRMVGLELCAGTRYLCKSTRAATPRKSSASEDRPSLARRSRKLFDEHTPLQWPKESLHLLCDARNTQFASQTQ